MSSVSRHDRFVDLAALACILLGAALYMTSNARLNEISRLSYSHPGPRNQSALAAADRARYQAYGGGALILAGCAVGVVGATRVARRRSVNAADSTPS